MKKIPRLAPTTRRNQQGCRRSQTQCTRTSDDQDREGGVEGFFRGTTEEQPGGEGDERDHHYHRYKHTCDPIGQTLYRRLLVLGVLDQSDHLGELRIPSHFCRTHHQPAADRDRSTDYLIPWNHVHREGLAGHHASIDSRPAHRHFPVGGNRLPGSNDEPIPTMS